MKSNKLTEMISTLMYTTNCIQMLNIEKAASHENAAHWESIMFGTESSELKN